MPTGIRTVSGDLCAYVRKPLLDCGDDGKAQSLASIPAWEFEPAIPRQPSLLPLRVQTLDPYLCLPIIRAWLHAHVRARNASRRFVAQDLGAPPKKRSANRWLPIPITQLVISGFLENEDQNLPWVRLRFRALTRTLVVSKFPISQR